MHIWHCIRENWWEEYLGISDGNCLASMGGAKREGGEESKKGMYFSYNILGHFDICYTIAKPLVAQRSCDMLALRRRASTLKSCWSSQTWSSLALKTHIITPTSIIERSMIALGFSFELGSRYIRAKCQIVEEWPPIPRHVGVNLAQYEYGHGCGRGCV